MDIMFWIWLGIVVVSAVVEFFTMEMIAIWITVGAIPSLIMSAIGGVHWAIQLAVFVVLSAVLILALRKPAKKLLFKKNENPEQLVGKEFKLISPVGAEYDGSIKVDGVVWSVTSESKEEIGDGEFVKLVKFENNKFYVERVQNKQEYMRKSDNKKSV